MEVITRPFWTQIRNRNRQYNRWNSAILKLPDEILSYIFLIAVIDAKDPPEFQRALESVCQRFFLVSRRDAIIANYAPPRRNAALIAELRGSTLDITYRIRTEKPDETFIGVVGPHFSRWRTFKHVENWWPSIGWGSMAQYLSQPAPFLVTFEAPHYMTNCLIPNFLGGYAPKLEELRISLLSVPQTTSPFPRLRVLDLYGWSCDEAGVSPDFALLKMLESCSQLIELYLDGEPSISGYGEDIQHVVELRCLRKIAFGDQMSNDSRKAFLSSLRTPLLSSVQLRLEGHLSDQQQLLAVYSDQPLGGIVSTVMQSVDSMIIMPYVDGSEESQTMVEVICSSDKSCFKMTTINPRFGIGVHPCFILPILAPAYLSNIRTLRLQNIEDFTSENFTEVFLSHLEGLETLSLTRVVLGLGECGIIETLGYHDNSMEWRCPRLTTLEIHACMLSLERLHSCILTRYGIVGHACDYLPSPLRILDLRGSTFFPKGHGDISHDDLISNIVRVVSDHSSLIWLPNLE